MQPQALKVTIDEPKNERFKKLMRKIFGVPLPKELGRSTSNALPSRYFISEEQKKEGAYTWDDWEEEVKTKYPIRYFISESVPFWLTVNIFMPVKNGWYWVKSNTYKKYHLIDIRQPKTGTSDDYRYGWVDEDRQIIYSCFGALISYYEETEKRSFHFSVKEHIVNYENSLKEYENSKNKTDEGTEAYKKIISDYKDIEELYQYWKFKRKESLREEDRIMNAWHSKRDTDRYGKEWDALKKHEEDFLNEETEMLIKLIKIRKYLWT